MTLNDTGLPLPGRELDAWVAEHVMGWHPISREVKLYTGPFPAFYVWDWVAVRRTELGPVVCWEPSTTHAFFQVMEADSGVHTWETMERYVRRDCYSPDGATKEELRLYVLLDTVVDRYQVSVWVSDYPSREAAYAHAVCCCLWKAEQ